MLWLKAVALFAIFVVITVIAWIARDDDWSPDTRGSTALWALFGLSFLVIREIWRVLDQSEAWAKGGDQERRVGRELEKLRKSGWVVSHDLPRDGRGNVDHLVISPKGTAFVIETKSGRSNAAGRNQAISNAVWAKEKFGQRSVHAVLCVGTDPPEQPKRHPNVWVLQLSDLERLLRMFG